LVGSAVARRFGKGQLITFWACVSIALGVVGTLRNLATQRALGVDPARVNVAGLYALLITAMLLILSAPTVALWRRTDGPQERVSFARQAAQGAGWTLAGLLIALLIALVLDFANIPFIPFR